MAIELQEFCLYLPCNPLGLQRPTTISSIFIGYGESKLDLLTWKTGGDYTDWVVSEAHCVINEIKEERQDGGGKVKKRSLDGVGEGVGYISGLWRNLVPGRLPGIHKDDTS